MAKAGLTHREHWMFAAKYLELQKLTRQIHEAIQADFGKSHKAAKQVMRAYTAIQRGKSELDEEYHKVTSDERFVRSGSAYYPLEDD